MEACGAAKLLASLKAPVAVPKESVATGLALAAAGSTSTTVAYASQTMVTATARLALVPTTVAALVWIIRQFFALSKVAITF